MRELVIAVSDLYLSAEAGAAGEGAALPALARLARFGRAAVLTLGWRAWIAEWAGRPDLAGAPPAALASAGTPAAVGGHAWLATPVHLIAGMSSVHLDYHGLLCLDPPEAAALAESFGSAFQGSGHRLEHLEGGALVALFPELPPVETVDPARVLGSSIAAALPSGAGARALARIGTEIEMWLHDHPVNRERARRGEPPVTALWLWGGGRALTDAEAAPRAPGRPLPAAFADDPCVRGLWRLCGGQAHDAPARFAEVESVGDDRVLLVVRAFGDGDPRSAAAPWSALERLDAHWIAPALEAMDRGAFAAVTVLASDRRLALRGRDRLKVWRRPRGALSRLAQ